MTLLLQAMTGLGMLFTATAVAVKSPVGQYHPGAGLADHWDRDIRTDDQLASFRN